MRFMNTWEIDEAVQRFADNTVLSAAAQTLANLRDCADANSDGWCYWPKPCRAAAQLQDLIQAQLDHDRISGGDIIISAAQVRKAYVPIKAFLTRSGLQCTLVVPQ